jgi:hypothetical protein
MVAEWLDPRTERTARCEHRPDRRHLTGLIDAIDSVLDDLERLHLADLHWVPAAYTTRLERLSARLPADVRSELRTGIRIAGLMETLYTIQGRLMSRRSGRTGDAAPDGGSPPSSTGGLPWSAYL